jgi:hypothetical protein
MGLWVHGFRDRWRRLTARKVALFLYMVHGAYGEDICRDILYFLQMHMGGMPNDRAELPYLNINEFL